MKHELRAARHWWIWGSRHCPMVPLWFALLLWPIALLFSMSGRQHQACSSMYGRQLHRSWALSQTRRAVLRHVRWLRILSLSLAA